MSFFGFILAFLHKGTVPTGQLP